MPQLSALFSSREPSAIRLAQIEYMKRTDGVEAINTAIGNVSLPMHPAMQARLAQLTDSESPFKDGVVRYSATVGEKETNQAFLHIISTAGFDTTNLYSQTTDGGSTAMELVILGVCGPAGSLERPLLLIDAAYTNYKALANRVGRATASVTRTLGKDGKFSLPNMNEIERVIQERNPGALLVIPYDNPTGHFYNQEMLSQLAQLCVKYDLWMISDEAYRQLCYTGDNISSIWGVTEQEVPGITGRRISIESASKVWNACGLRIGALVTDNQLLHQKSVAEYTANLCPNVIGQYIFGSLAHLSKQELEQWYDKQRAYYKDMSSKLTAELRALMPKLIVSSPDSSIYSVVDVSDVAPADFDAQDFVMHCAREGKLEINGRQLTLLASPMAGFYSVETGQVNPGKKQMRIAYVETPERMALVPELFARLFEVYIAS